jgi:hypothetical protein
MDPIDMQFAGQLPTVTPFTDGGGGKLGKL